MKMTKVDPSLIDKISITSADEAREMPIEERSQFFVINVAEPEGNPFADVNIPLGISNMYRNTVPHQLLDLVASVIHYAIVEQGKKVLIHCRVGLERSPMCVMWYFHKYSGLSIEDAYTTTQLIKPDLRQRAHWITHDDRESWLEDNRNDRRFIDNYHLKGKS
jgi:protein-tyrosine phosphatase